MKAEEAQALCIEYLTSWFSIFQDLCFKFSVIPLTVIFGFPFDYRLTALIKPSPKFRIYKREGMGEWVT